MSRRALAAAAAWALIFCFSAPTAVAQNSPSIAQKSEGKHRDISWEELVPKDWDPLKSFQGMDLSSLQDNDPKAGKLLQRMRAAWDKAPTNPKLAGAAVRIPGFIAPLDQDAVGLKEFLLVPYFGACIHTPPPPANQIIHVKLKVAVTGFRAMDTVWVSGTLSLMRTHSEMGVSGYQIDASAVAPYTEQPPKP